VARASMKPLAAGVIASKKDTMARTILPALPI
jgi:hypothetical protein